MFYRKNSLVVGVSKYHSNKSVSRLDTVILFKAFYFSQK